jgi:superfamily II DNA or RNA helicase
MWSIRFQSGTILVEGASPFELGDGFVHDDRVGAARGPAHRYADVVRLAHARSVPLQDDARAYETLDALEALTTRTPRDYQVEALDAWEAAGRRGAVVLPTGAGKTHVAELAILRCKRSALVLAPTIDLIGQWHDRLTATFGGPIGLLGGGHHELEPITVSTYDSAYLHLARYGARFGLVVFDEVHHLPAPAYLQAAEATIAPWRLGLTATWERQDGRESELSRVLGDVVYERTITELSGSYLADYDTVRLEIRLSPDERERYLAARKIYGAFIGQQRIPIRSPQGWQLFIQKASRSKAGREAFLAYQESRRIIHGAERKLDLLGTLLDEEWGRRTIVFTNDNRTAYDVSRQFLLPCITHHTDVKERRAWLDAFQSGEVPVLVTSRVLYEGVDLPAAEVAIVLSGTGTVREHVQRLGRILRPGEGKRAILYEIVAADTTEKHTSDRRRKHAAYRA